MDTKRGRHNHEESLRTSNSDKSRASFRLMKASSKRWLIVGAAMVPCFGLILVFLLLRPTYWAYSTVRMQPFTNVVPARALQGRFQKQVRKAVPSVHRLTINPSFSTVSAAMEWSTNDGVSSRALPVSAELRIMALGSSPENAQGAANDAAVRLRTFLTQRYGGSVSVMTNTGGTGRYSFPSDLGLKIERLLQR
jgi:hypothetical protein